MAIFEDVKLGWHGEEYVIPAHRVLGAIGVIEEHITFAEMMDGLQRGRPRLLALSRAWGGVLRYAGARVTDEEVYAGMFGGETVAGQVIDAVNHLLLLMMPPSAIASGPAGQAVAGNLRAASRPSKRSTKQRSALAAG